MPKPSAASLQQDIAALKQTGISCVVSLLESDEAELLSLQREEAECALQNLAFTQFPIKDYGVPEDLSSLTALIDRIYHQITDGNNTVVHCRGGIGRSGLICCCLLIKDGRTAAQAISLVSKLRGHEVPETTDQLNMVLNYTSA